jgi:hypothetical protein
MQDTSQSHSSPQSSRTQPSRFVEHMQHLFGDEPDPIFLEESWMVGVPAAVERHHLRRTQREAYFSQHETGTVSSALSELERIASLIDERPTASGVEAFLEERAQPLDSRYSAAWLQRVAVEPEPGDDTSAATADEHHSCAISGAGMSVAQATELLGVSPTATREKLRSVYRRMVSQCHPDRFQHAPDSIRHHATQQMAELNEAYRVLCENLLRQAA